MPWFRSTYYPYLRQTNRPLERFTVDEARQRRVEAVLQKNLEIQLRLGRLSPESVKISERIKPFEGYFRKPSSRISSTRVDHELLAAVQKAGLMPAARKYGLLNLFGLKNRPQAPAREVGSTKAKPASSDRRFYNPTGKDYGVDAYGNVAKVGYHLGQVLGSTAAASIPRFVYPSKAIPCVMRAERREVMFAKKKAGRGYRTAKKRSPLSLIIC